MRHIEVLDLRVLGIRVLPEGVPQYLDLQLAVEVVGGGLIPIPASAVKRIRIGWLLRITLQQHE